MMKAWLKRNISRLNSLLIVGLCCLVVVGCVATSSSDRASADQITIGTTAKVKTLDPANAYSSFAGTLIYNLSDRLYSYKLGTSELEPQLATTLPKVSADGLTYTIPLRQGVVFHDGSKFDAKAMEFSLQRFIQNAGAPSFLLADAIASVKATGEYELTIKLQKPFAAFPSLLAFSGACAVSPQAYEIKENSFKSDAFVGTGPYKLVKYGTDSLKLEAFDRYWGKKPTNPGVNVQFFSSAANLFNAFRTGAIDVAAQGLAVDHIRNLQDNGASRGWKISESASGVNYLSVNLKSPPLDRVDVRQALAAAMDRSVLADRVFQGQAEPLYSLIPANMKEQKPVFKNLMSEDAIALLTKAGYSDANPLKVEFWYRSNIVNDQLVAATLKAVVQKKVGKLLHLDLKSVESTTAYKNLETGAYPMFLLDMSPDFLDPDSYIQPFMDCAQGSEKDGCTKGSSFGQGSFYFSDRANQLIAKSRAEQNPAARQKLFEDLQDVLLTDVPFIPLWQSKDYLVAQKNIDGAMLDATQKIPFSVMKKAST